MRPGSLVLLSSRRFVAPAAGGGGGGVAASLVEDFSTYSSTANLIADPRNLYSEAEDVTSILTLTNDGYGGSAHAMRYSWAAGGCTDTTQARRCLNHTAQTSVWYEIYARFSASFDTRTGGSCPEEPSYKFLFFSNPGDAYLNRCQLITGLNSGADWLFGDATDQNRDVFGSSEDHWDGEWHRYRFQFVLHGSNGTSRCWFDDTLVVNHTGISTNNGGALSNLSWVVLGANINQGPLNNATLDWGKISVWYAGNDPGWL